MELSKETKDKIDKLPIVLRMAVNYLLDAVDKIINGECNEDAVTSTMATLNNNASGRICKDDVLNYDKAGNILGFGATNRTALKALLDKHGIKQVVINNMKCGFLRSDIMALRDKLNEDIKKREDKRKRKEERELLKSHRREDRFRALFGKGRK